MSCKAFSILSWMRACINKWIIFELFYKNGQFLLPLLLLCWSRWVTSSLLSLYLFLPLTLPRSCCSSIWTSMSLLLSSSLVTCTESAITSGFSGFLPFLRGGAEEGVADDIALWPPSQDGHRVPGVAKPRGRVSRCCCSSSRRDPASSSTSSSLCGGQVYIVAGGVSVWERQTNRGK